MGLCQSSCTKISAKSSYEEESDCEPRYRNKIRPSDEDCVRWVGEPDVDRKATEFIAKFHETRVTDPETIQI